MINWTPENLAWLAGLLEGEGSFYVRRARDRHPRVAVSLQMTDRDIVERAKAIAGCGGAVLVGDRSRHYPGKGWKDIYHWRVQAEDHAVALMWAIYPWMGARRRGQIKACLAEWSSTPRGRRSASIAS